MNILSRKIELPLLRVTRITEYVKLAVWEERILNAGWSACNHPKISSSHSSMKRNQFNFSSKVFPSSQKWFKLGQMSFQLLIIMSNHYYSEISHVSLCTVFDNITSSQINLEFPLVNVFPQQYGSHLRAVLKYTSLGFRFLPSPHLLAFDCEPDDQTEQYTKIKHETENKLSRKV